MVKVIVESGEERKVFEGNYVFAIALKTDSDPMEADVIGFGSGDPVDIAAALGSSIASVLNNPADGDVLANALLQGAFSEKMFDD
ncbi:MAG TPA: hypothetical protein H9968_03010 [Candidatus Anaerobutyricum stercoris]|uniref:Uncharacterized protein n=1 Tax=Candidatus Anaerobutyricum stercoris TaxID=2838457 RepID=A0A9D2EJQ3_9FIRM|nr:hypothetical protein [Candidatus Anaerobutyricum stercoris]